MMAINFLRIFHVTIVLIGSSGQQNSETPIDRSLSDDLITQSSDLVVNHKIGSTDVILRAYKLKSRPDTWFSIGYPTFLDSPMYNFGAGLTTKRIQLLPDDQKSAIENAAKLQNPNIDKVFVYLIPLQKISCSTTLVSEDEELTIYGIAQDINHYQATLKIQVEQGSKEWVALLTSMWEHHDLQWKCSFLAAGREKMIDKVKVKGEVLEDVCLELNVFGPDTTTYLSNRQVKDFAQGVREKINEEEALNLGSKYDDVISRKILQATDADFQNLPIDIAIRQISRMKMEQGTCETAVMTCLSNMFSVEKVGQQEIIGFVVDSAWRNASSSQNNGSEFESNEPPATRGLAAKKCSHPGIDTRSSEQTVRVNQVNWAKSGLEQQLSELNWGSRDDIRWIIKDSRLVPESLNLLKIDKSALDDGFQIVHRELQVINPGYSKDFVLPSVQHVAGGDMTEVSIRYDKAVQELNKIWAKINQTDTTITSPSQIDDLRKRASKTTEEIQKIRNAIAASTSSALNVEEVESKMKTKGEEACRIIKEYAQAFANSQAAGPKESATSQIKKPIIQSYKVVCKDIESPMSDQDNYSLSKRNYVTFDPASPRNKNTATYFYMDKFACLTLGGDYFVQNVKFNCKATYQGNNHISKHCFRCCHYEFVY